MAPESVHPVHSVHHSADRPPGQGHGGARIPLIDLVLSGALRIHPPERGPGAEPARDD